MKNKIKIIGLLFLGIAFFILINFQNRPIVAKADGVVNCGPPGNGCVVTFIQGGDTTHKTIRGYMERQE